MKHGTLKIHSKERVTLFQQINTDIAQTAERGTRVCVSWSKVLTWVTVGGGATPWGFQCGSGRGRALRGRIKGRRIWAVWRKRSRNWERGARRYMMWFLGFVQRTHTHAHMHEPRRVNTPSQSDRQTLEEGGTSGPMSQLLGVEREGKRESKWHNEEEADGSGVKLISFTPAVSLWLPSFSNVQLQICFIGKKTL